MNLQMDINIAKDYSNNSQRTRIITETWAGQNLFCPYCGNPYVCHFENNRPVADYFCPHCREEYELKSKNGSISNKIADGAYNTMIHRIESVNNPSFFFMQYSRTDLRVKNLLFVPKYFFVPDIIEKRKPLTDTARRAGWTGCNIILKKIPEEGLVYIVKDEEIQPVTDVIAKVEKTDFIKTYKLDGRGWILDVLNCVNQIDGRDFSLQQIYQFEDILAEKHPENHHIKEKIRQQLQVLRDKDIIEFKGNGQYRKVLGK